MNSNVLDSYIVGSEFELQSGYYVYFQNNAFGKIRNPLIPIAIG